MLSARSSIEHFRRTVEPFLRGHGFQASELTVLRGGANNRVYRISEGNRDAVLKHYFKNPNDPRDRFRAERAFYDVLWNCGLRSIPEPFGWDAELRVGLFSFVHGRKLTPQEVTVARIDQAARFIVELNRCHNSPNAAAIQNASEACFSLNEHLELVDRRVARLLKLEGQSSLDSDARSFVFDQLQPAWQRIRDRIASGFGVPASAGKTANMPIATDDTQTPRNIPSSQNPRCLSPSDFGFHNALLTSDASLRFFDFEYAGWDDPAKLVCDFFCQPELPASLDHWDRFIGAIGEITERESNFNERARALLPAYQIKWCCIMLNDFLRTDQLRREFALNPVAAETRKQQQLEKAREALKRLT